jgi:hypothetical protein
VRESWPPKTTGPNLPVRYCDINKEDKDKTIIGYALVDTSAVNWLVSIWVEGACVYTPVLSDIRKTERILQRAYPSVQEHAYHKDGHLFEEGGLRNFARQYVFMKSPEGKKFVYVNFVLLRWSDLEDKEAPVYDPNDMDTPPPPPPTRFALSRYWLRVDDGGDGFWRAMLDLEDGIVERLFINGP